MIDELIGRASVLMQQNRYTEADRILSDVLGQAPDNTYVLAMASEVALRMENYKKSNELIDSAIGLEPDSAPLFHIKAQIMLETEQMDKAEEAIAHAIHLDASSAQYHALWAHLKLIRKQYEKALEYSNKSLELEPDNLLGLNTRSQAQFRLKLTKAAFSTIEGALMEDPNNTYTHANYGWSLLESGERVKALEHFREALKNNPNNRNAQAGMVEALKAKYIFYRLFLKYAFWMGSLTAKYQWGVIIGFYVLFRVIKSVSERNEMLEPLLTPIVYILAGIAFSTWVLSPLMNLFLRLNKYGKHMLTQKQKLSSNFVGISMLIFVVGLSMVLYTQLNFWFAVTLFGLMMMVPCSMMFVPSKNNMFLIYTVGMAAVGAIAISTVATSGDIGNPFAVIFLVAFIAFQWIANYFQIKKSNL